MNEANSNRSRLDASLVIDRICDEFEQQCVKNNDPGIEEFLEKVEAENQPRLFKQLLLMELELNTSRPIIETYLNRFPGFRESIETVFGELNLLDWTNETIGPFHVTKEIGRGGMGVVYEAKDKRLDRSVAIKMLTRERRSDQKWLRRFYREAQMASGLNHPNIITIYEIGEDKETPYIVTELVGGVTLKSKMAGRPLSLQEALDYSIQISSGMSVAHQAGIIHRDLKTDNIMIRKDGLAKILDFGLAKSNELELGEASAISTTGSITGTIHFMSPEQARGEPLGQQTDVFSFGVLLYLMLTGKYAFDGRSLGDIIAAILKDEPSEFTVSVPNLLKEMVFACLNKSPNERPKFDSIMETLEGIQTNLNGERTHGKNANSSSQTKNPTATDVDDEELMPSAIRYAQSGDVNIAWQEIGSGPIDIVFVMGWVSHLEWFWKDPSFAAFLRRLASFARVILFDKRGTGLSDRVPVNELPNLETRMDDVRAVMEAAESKQAVLCGVSEGGPLCALFAATHPDKTIAITMIGSYSRRLWAEDYPWGPTAEQRENFLKEIGTNWGGPLGLAERAPSKVNDEQFRDWWASYLRMGASPGAAVALTKMNAQIDIRTMLPSINVPTLVIHRTGDRCLTVEEGQHLADKIPGAQFVELPGDDHLPFVGDADSVLNEIELFLTGMKKSAEHDFVLATALCIRLESMDESANSQFKKMVEHEIALFRGNHFTSEQNSLLVTFDGPVRSVLCAKSICRLAQRLNLKIKCGLDTGTCNINKTNISGPAVDGAKDVSGFAQEMDVLVTGNLKNLISGNEICFEDVDVDANATFDGRLYKAD